MKIKKLAASIYLIFLFQIINICLCYDQRNTQNLNEKASKKYEQELTMDV